MQITKFDTVEDSLDYMDLVGLDVYEFGVFNGNTLGRIVENLRRREVGVRYFWGFDSFEGLPAEDPKVQANPEWPTGAFNIQRDFNLNSIDEAVEFVYKRISEVNLDNNVTLIPGYFEKTCTTENFMKLKMSQASYINVDCDIYLSTKQVLDFIFIQKVPVWGTIIRFDDIASTPRSAGQHLAWDCAKSRYGVEFEQLSYNVFRVLNYDLSNG